MCVCVCVCITGCCGHGEGGEARSGAVEVLNLMHFLQLL
jgi:hypothetical protein